MLRQLISAIRNRTAKINERPIILLGNQKSGGSAIAHLLANYGGLSKTVDIPPIWPPKAIKIMRGEASFAHFVNEHRLYFSKKLMKEPNLTFFADQVIDRFPEAQYVFVVRDPRDNIRSHLNRRGIPGHLDQLEEQHLSSSPYSNFMIDGNIWNCPGENYVSVMAHRWKLAVDAYLTNRSRYALVRYEDFLKEKAALIGRLAMLLGIAQQHDISSAVDIQYQPRGDRDTSWHEFYGSKNLSRITQVCGPRMCDFGYPTAE